MLRPTPSPFPTFNVRSLPKGSELVRLHDPISDGDACNPCKGGPGRFSPLAHPDGTCLPTLYAADTFECAVHESLFHDLAYAAPKKFIRLDKVTPRAVSWLRTTIDMQLASLNEPDLMLLNLSRAELIASPPGSYTQTARWAEAFHRVNPRIAGLAWTSRRCDPSQAYVFFGDRLPKGAFEIHRRVSLSSSPKELLEIREFGRRAGIIITL